MQGFWIFLSLLCCFARVRPSLLQEAGFSDGDLYFAPKQAQVPSGTGEFFANLHDNSVEDDTLMARQISTVAPDTTTKTISNVNIQLPASSNVSLTFGSGSAPVVLSGSSSEGLQTVSTLAAVTSTVPSTSGTVQDISTSLSSELTSTSIIPSSVSTTASTTPSTISTTLLTTASTGPGVVTAISLDLPSTLSPVGGIPNLPSSTTTGSSSTTISNRIDVGSGISSTASTSSGVTTTTPSSSTGSVSTTANATTAPVLTTTGNEIPVLPGFNSSDLSVFTTVGGGSGITSTMSTMVAPAVPLPGTVPAVAPPTAVAPASVQYMLINYGGGYALVPVAVQPSSAVPVQPNTVVPAPATIPVTDSVAQTSGTSPYSGLALVYPGGAASGAIGNNVVANSGAASGLGSLPTRFGSSPFLRPFSNLNNVWAGLLSPAGRADAKLNETSDKPLLETITTIAPPMLPPPGTIEKAQAAELVGTDPNACKNNCLTSSNQAVCQTVCAGKNVNNPNQNGFGTFTSWNKAF